ncbi:MAG: hypothetical protein CMF17_08000 [Idiomarinaceae bacterium]|nr:hypothetical protein [Idiomarinaceae bacterium]
MKSSDWNTVSVAHNTRIRGRKLWAAGIYSAVSIALISAIIVVADWLNTLFSESQTFLSQHPKLYTVSLIVMLTAGTMLVVERSLAKKQRYNEWRDD